MKKTDLKPCPFCGGKASLVLEFCGRYGLAYYVRCIVCDCRTLTDRNKTDTIFRWNKRVSDEINVQPTMPGKWIKVKENPLDGEFACSQCGERIDIADGGETPLDRGFCFCPNCGVKMEGNG